MPAKYQVIKNICNNGAYNLPVEFDFSGGIIMLVKTRLREFKLSGRYNLSLDERLVYAQEKSIGYLEFLELLLEDEHSNRNNNGYKKRYSKAKLPARKTIEDFDFSFQPSIDKRVINDCCTTKFVKEHHNVVFIGSPGVGKTHLAIVLWG